MASITFIRKVFFQKNHSSLYSSPLLRRGAGGEAVARQLTQRAFLFFTLLFFFNKISATQIEVGEKFSCKSISSALAIAKAGDEIMVNAGLYHEKNIEVKIRVTISGKNSPIVDAQEGGQIFLITHDSVKISGLTIQNTGMSAMNDYAGIRTQEANAVVLYGNVFLNCCYGIFLAGSNHCIVSNNVFKGNPAHQQLAGNGIHCWQCTHISIHDNDLTGHRDGIYFEFVYTSVISNNHSYENLRYGLHFMFNDNNRFVKNIFERNGAGVAIMYSKHITMLNNSYSENVGGSAYGLLLKDIQDSQILYNTFNKNTTAIYMEGVSRTVVLHNDFLENGWAMRVQSSCDDNTISFNNFFGNTFDIATNGTLVLNTYNCNFWDHYEGYDLNKNGIGDIPFRPVSVFGMLSESMPESMIMMHSFSVSLIDRIEKVVPDVIPENLVDNFPVMKKINNAYPGSGTE
ncbi:MAG: nitrous oxide reductase family maturation protein NosD [Sphingobacteriales bacterium]|nr:MAG: nitrous oxide reductase family maturation protein NosD [Sphingobacteriales bacterium]